jgi:pyruvyltransferase
MSNLLKILLFLFFVIFVISILTCISNKNTKYISNEYFSNEHIPIFIIVHDQFEILKKSVNSYEKYIKSPYKIIFHDVASTYYETLEYLKEKSSQGYPVYHTNVNNHHTIINSVNDYLQKHPECKYCVITDPDIELYNVNYDILDLYIYALNKLKKNSVGPMLEIQDIPDFYPRKKAVLYTHYKQFWNKPRKIIDFNGAKYQYVECNTDTTFQLFSTKYIPKSFPYTNSIRFLAPYSAKHLDWYINPNNLTPCQLYYLNNTTNISHWNNNNWKNDVINNKLTSYYKPKYIYIYYAVCKCRNFGDEITKYIYQKMTNKNPIRDISGGQNKENVVFGAGSILSQCTNNSVIWGTGLMFGNEKIKKPKLILSVRGPLTRKKIIEQGYYCPEKYGDIGLILPYFYNPKIIKKYDIGIIPHYVDIDRFKKLFKTLPSNILMIDVRNSVETVVNNILQCKTTMSSSLHGIIISHAYNIKCLWIIMTDLIGGKYYKYKDYYGSLNSKYIHIKPYNLNKQITVEKITSLINNYTNPVFPIKTKHILQSCPF